MVTLPLGFWAGKRVLVTGHTGFKGAWLSFWLTRLGAEVAGFALEPEGEQSLFAQADIAKCVVHTIGDIREVRSVRKAFGAFQPEVVFHLAAQALVRRSYLDPLSTISSNVQGTANVLDALRDVPSVRAAVVVTTDKCYLNRETLTPYVEDDPLGGRDPYSASKACAEILAAAYRDSYLSAGGIAMATARAGNVIGGGDWAEDRLIPDCVRAFVKGETVTLRNPAAIRPWQHVLDPLAGYLLLAQGLCEQRPGFASAFNFGPDARDARPVSWVVSEAARLWGDGRWRVEGDAGANPHEAQLLTLDASKARDTLNWNPLLSIEDGLAWTMDWYRSVNDGDSARSAMQRQLDRYGREAARDSARLPEN